MNKIFGFFKQKIVEAKIQNKKDLQSLVNVLSGDDSGYKQQIILDHLQKIKSNYMTWNILIANQASTGLYYSQLHNHGVCMKKIDGAKQKQENIQKHKMTKEYMSKTHEQLKQIGDLNGNWVKSMGQMMEKVKEKRMKKFQEKSQLKKVQQSKQIQQNQPVRKSSEKIILAQIFQKQTQPTIAQNLVLQPKDGQILIQVQKW